MLFLILRLFQKEELELNKAFNSIKPIVFLLWAFLLPKIYVNY